jgi:hypothetical protein
LRWSLFYNLNNRFLESTGISTPILTESDVPFWLGRDYAFPSRLNFCSASAHPAPPQLTRHRHSSVLTSSAHPRAPAPSKCRSGYSPSPHLCLVPVLGPRCYWILAPCSCLPSREFNQLYMMLYLSYLRSYYLVINYKL